MKEQTMSDRDVTTNDDEGRLLSQALAHLADAMPEDPYRVDEVHTRARRLRNRRRVARAAVGVMATAATVAAFVAVRPDSTPVSMVSASQPTTTALPSCSAALAAAPRVADPKKDPVVVDEIIKPDVVDAADAAKIAAKADRATMAQQGVKGIGIIVATSEASVTIKLEAPMSGEPADLTGRISSRTVLAEGGVPVDVRPAVNPGDRVAFGASQSDDGAWELIFLEVRPVDPPVANPEPDADAAKAAKRAAVAAESNLVKLLAQVVSVEPNSLTLRVIDGDLAGQVLTAAMATNTVFSAGDETCVDPQLSAGLSVGVLLASSPDGTYVVQRLALLPQS
jgi:hypothetical protein